MKDTNEIEEADGEEDAVGECEADAEFGETGSECLVIGRGNLLHEICKVGKRRRRCGEGDKKEQKDSGKCEAFPTSQIHTRDDESKHTQRKESDADKGDEWVALMCCPGSHGLAAEFKRVKHKAFQKTHIDDISILFVDVHKMRGGNEIVVCVDKNTATSELEINEWHEPVTVGNTSEEEDERAASEGSKTFANGNVILRLAEGSRSFTAFRMTIKECLDRINGQK